MIVVQVKTLDGHGIQTRAIFNDVETLLNLRSADIEETPDSGAAVETAYHLGIPKAKAGMKTLLDIGGLMGADAVQKIESVAVKQLSTLKQNINL